MEDLVCAWCKTEFRRKTSLAKKNKSGVFYCCPACSQEAMKAKYRKNRVTVPCKYCGKRLHRHPGEIISNKTGKFHCKNKCYLNLGVK